MTENPLRAALEDIVRLTKSTDWANLHARAALATPSDAPEQKPVAWIDEFGNVFPLSAWKNHDRASHHDIYKKPWKPLFTTPQPATEQAELIEVVEWLTNHLAIDHNCMHMDPASSGIPAWIDRVLAAAKGEQR